MRLDQRAYVMQDFIKGSSKGKKPAYFFHLLIIKRRKRKRKRVSPVEYYKGQPVKAYVRVCCTATKGPGGEKRGGKGLFFLFFVCYTATMGEASCTAMVRQLVQCLLYVVIFLIKIKEKVKLVTMAAAAPLVATLLFDEENPGTTPLPNLTGRLGSAGSATDDVIL